MKAHVKIVIVHYRTLEQTLNCLESLRALDYADFSVLVVDNCSNDGSGEKLQNYCEDSQRFSTLLNFENRGFAAGCNIGIREALKDGADYVWLLNPDTVVEDSSLSCLVNGAIESPEAGAFGSKILFKRSNADEKEIWSAGADVDELRGQVSMRGYGEVDKGQYDSHGPCGYLPGASLFVKASIFEKVGLLDESYFLFFEETDWCARVRRAGLELRLNPNSVVYHDFEKEKQRDPLRVYYYNRNELYFWSKFGKPSLKIRQFFRTLFVDLPRTYLAKKRALPGGEGELLQMQLNSYLDFLRGYRGMIAGVQK